MLLVRLTIDAFSKVQCGVYHNQRCLNQFLFFFDSVNIIAKICIFVNTFLYFPLLFPNKKATISDDFRAINSTLHTHKLFILPATEANFTVYGWHSTELFDCISFVVCHARRCCTAPRQSRRCRQRLLHSPAAVVASFDTLQRHHCTFATQRRLWLSQTPQTWSNVGTY